MPDDDRLALHDGIRLTAVALGQAQIPYALCGGYAAWARGAPEPSHDADFVISEDSVEQAKKALAEAGLDVREPAEDWLFKAYNGDALIDVLFRMVGQPVDPQVFERATTLEVLAVRMPVLSATDNFSAQLRVMNEHYCDFGRLLPRARALREQIDWDQVRAEAVGDPFAGAFLHLITELGIIE
jgi:predicted O-methyltransferase YrrM